MPHTSRQRPPRARLRTAGLAALAATLGSALLAPGTAAASAAASAAAAPPAADAGMVHPEQDTLGSTIAAHEPVQRGQFAPASGTPGIDVSHHQGAVDWTAVATAKRFAYLKATEGTTYRDPNFGDYYDGAFGAGMVRGAYHFALPDTSGGVAQATFFVNHGGGWSADGRTLPPMLDIEYNPYGATCYGLSPAAMSRWIADFSTEVQRRTGRFPVIYTTTNWWNKCTGANRGFARNNPLFVARYASSVGALPAGWEYQTIWQYSSSGRTPGIGGNVDSDVFNGSPDKVLALARG